ncbi:hypothetical protein KAX75_01320 [candidate division WOR-3 bacterium]|nr:hypothetical protein [candidate division WOR-3 bacterium]
MPDTFAITVIFIIVVAVVVAFIKGRSRDKCLIDFSGNLVTIEEITGKIIWGKLRVESTGLELDYSTKHKDKDGHEKKSYILYKQEYPNIRALIRYHDELDEPSKKERDEELKKTYHPTAIRKLKRKIQNFFNTARDSVLEAINLLIGQAKRTAPGGAILTSQDKSISKMKQELKVSMETAYEPLLERHIGKKVILELTKGDKIFEYQGIFKDYTVGFIELMDVDYRIKEDQPVRKADLVVPRGYGIIRHLGE